MFLVTGVLAALLEAQKSGKGQVVDAAITDGSAVLMGLFNTLHAEGLWSTERGTNTIDSGSHFYDVYETSDGQYIALGSIEPKFYELLMEKAGLDRDLFRDQMNREKWPDLKKALSDVVRSKSQREWCALMEGTDVCFAPVLSFEQAPLHPHNQARNTYMELGGTTQPAPAPRFSRTPSSVRFPGRELGSDTATVLKEWGLDR
jgi:alpha-methylacyl-CoA racemase